MRAKITTALDLLGSVILVAGVVVLAGVGWGLVALGVALLAVSWGLSGRPTPTRRGSMS